MWQSKLVDCSDLELSDNATSVLFFIVVCQSSAHKWKRFEMIFEGSEIPYFVK